MHLSGVGVRLHLDSYSRTMGFDIWEMPEAIDYAVCWMLYYSHVSCLTGPVYGSCWSPTSRLYFRVAFTLLKTVTNGVIVIMAIKITGMVMANAENLYDRPETRHCCSSYTSWVRLAWLIVHWKCRWTQQEASRSYKGGILSTILDLGDKPVSGPKRQDDTAPVDPI